MKHMLAEGASAISQMTVGPEHTSVRMGSGDVMVLATPWLVALAENAAMKAAAGYLPSHLTTVGVQVSISHLAPTPIGVSITAEARLVQLDDRQLNFEIKVTDPFGLVGEGNHQRRIVDRDRFRERMERKLR